MQLLLNIALICIIISASIFTYSYLKARKDRDFKKMFRVNLLGLSLIFIGLILQVAYYFYK